MHRYLLKCVIVMKFVGWHNQIWTSSEMIVWPTAVVTKANSDFSSRVSIILCGPRSKRIKWQVVYLWMLHLNHRCRIDNSGSSSTLIAMSAIFCKFVIIFYFQQNVITIFTLIHYGQLQLNRKFHKYFSTFKIIRKT